MVSEDDERLDEEEHFHFQRVVGSFFCYERAARADSERTRRAAARLPPRLARLLPDRCLERRVQALNAAAAANGSFLRRVVDGQGGFGPPGEGGGIDEQHPRALPRENDFSKVRSTLHSCVRDWGDEGSEERSQCYAPLLEALEAAVAPRAGARVLVPGAGLARLVLEVAARGYGAQGNEFSYHMLLCSNFLLNSGLRPRAITIYPYVDQPSNCVEAADRVRPVRIPDVVPDELLANSPFKPDFSMAAGEFLDVYADQASSWDAVVSCFFLDTAPVALEYVDAIWRLLKPGGALINLGPLLYHWVPNSSADLEGGLDANGAPTAGADDRYDRALEFSWDELKHALVTRGFVFEREEVGRDCTYTCNRRSMMRTQYKCVFFTARKPLPGPPAEGA